MTNLVESNSKSNAITKTKAKKSLFIFVDKSKKSKIINEIKKIYSDVSLVDLELNEKSGSQKLLVEFSSYEKAKKAKDQLKQTFKNDSVKIESALYEKKKENRKKEKEYYSKNKSNENVEGSGGSGGGVELNGRLGDRSRNLFEIRMPKLILRNLSFKITDEVLQKEMEKFGQVKLVNLPKKDDGKLAGYGFVTFETMNEARKAMEDFNSRNEKFYGTKVAVDWCLPKNLFLKNTNEANKTQEQNDVEENGTDDENEENEDENDEDKDEDEEEIDEDKDDEDEGDEESENEDLNEEDDEEESEGETKKLNQNKKPKVEVNKKYEDKKKTGTLDVQEKRTVFIRNLSFDTTEELVNEAFSKFGNVKFVKLCYDKDLERPRGTAFIQFETKEDAMNACAESGMFEMDSRILQIDMAVSRTQANELSEEKKSSTAHEAKDNRNLSLAKEGVIYPNSYEAKGVSKADMIRRQKLEKANSDKLKLLHFFVSPTRLSIHNIPISCSDEELKNIFLKAINPDAASSNSKSKLRFLNSGIVECRIMRDLTRVNSDGVCRSKGYGFAEFKTFELAKKALHATNNNPNLFKTGTRLIVQFSIEDMRALQKKKARIEKSKLKLNEKKGKKFSRFNKNKKGKDNQEEQNGGAHFDDDSLNIDKIKQKNLLKVHNLEKKLEKRKSEEENKVIKKQKRQTINQQKLIEKQAKQEESIMRVQELKAKKRQRQKENKKMNKSYLAEKKKLKNKNNVDNVDKLIDKLYESKTKASEKRTKWFD